MLVAKKEALKRGATAFKIRSGRVVASSSGRTAVNQFFPVVAGRSVLGEDCRSFGAGANPSLVTEDYRYFLAADLVLIGIGAVVWIRE